VRMFGCSSPKNGWSRGAILAQQGQRVEAETNPFLSSDNVQPTASWTPACEARKDQINAGALHLLNDQELFPPRSRDFYITQRLKIQDQAKADAATWITPSSGAIAACAW